MKCAGGGGGVHGQMMDSVSPWVGREKVGCMCVCVSGQAVSLRLVQIDYWNMYHKMTSHPINAR